MPVQRAEDVLNKHMGEWLASRVPEDRMCTYSVAQVTYTFKTCEEHGEQEYSAVVWQIHIYMEPIDPDSKDKSIRFNAIAPYEELDDGDTAWLENYLEPMWQDIVFSQMMDPVNDEIEQAVQEPEAGG